MAIRSTRWLFPLIVLLSLAAPVAPVASAGQKLLIRNVNLYDGSGGAARPRVSVLLADGRIARILPGQDEAPVVDAVLDARGKTLMPGLVDLQTHLEAPAAYLTGWVPASTERHAAALLRAGVTTAQSTGNRPDGVGDRIAIGSVAGANLRVRFTGPCVLAPGGRLPWSSGAFLEVSTAAEVKDAVARVAAQGAATLEIVWDDLAWTGLNPVPSLDDDTVGLLIEEAHGASLRVAVWSHTGQRLARAAVLGADVVVGLPLVGGYDEDFDRVLRDEHVTLIPGLAGIEARFAYFDDLERLRDDYYERRVDRLLRDVLVSNRYEMVDRQRGRPAGLARRLYPQLARGLVASMTSGLNVALGSFSGEPLAFHGCAPMRELALSVAHGVPAGLAIQAATDRAARILGLGDELGRVAEGRIADLVVLNGDPGRDPSAFRRVVAVFVGGVSIDLARLEEVLRGPRPGDPSHPVPEILETFESRTLDELATRVQLFDDHDAGGKSGAAVRLVGGDDQTGALRLDARLRPTERIVAFASVQISPGSAAPGPWDVTRWRGIRVRCRGSEQPVVLLVSTHGVRDGNDYRVTFTPRSTWSELRLPFTSLSQRHPGRQVPWTGRDVKAVRFLVESDTPLDIHLEIDEIGFYK